MENIKIVTIAQERLDFSTVVEFEQQMMKYFRESHKAIIVNMKNVDYADSRAIGLFVGLKMQCKNKGILFGLCCMHPDVRYIFKVTSVDTAIDVFDCEDEALNHFETILNE
ncbi:MAG: STAS domain-containing protein [Cyanobacteriota bacterium]